MRLKKIDLRTGIFKAKFPRHKNVVSQRLFGTERPLCDSKLLTRGHTRWCMDNNVLEVSSHVFLVCVYG